MGSFNEFVTRMKIEKPGFAELWESRRIINDLETVMLAKGISQKELVTLSGIPQPQLSRFFSGSNSPTIATVTKVAKALGVRVSVVFPEDIDG